MTNLRKSCKDCRIELIGKGEILTCFMHGRDLGVAGVAELPYKDREGGDRRQAFL